MATINWNELTPACYAIAEANHCDAGKARDMVQKNIADGNDTYVGADAIPAEYRPDWVKLHDEDISDNKGTYDNGAFNLWIDVMQAAYKELAELWNHKDYAGMVRVMDMHTPSALK